MADARKDKRTLLSLKIRYKSATLEDFIERYASDISRGGVFIKAKKPLVVGTLLKFEFLLQDQSTLIHGVGRVVWRRDPSEGDAQNPSGMGIKFIKMDAESRALVQRIAEGRQSPGVFEQGKQGQPVDAPASSALATPVPDDRTKVRHVSEFLASALEEGGAGEAATNEARAGAQRARQLSNDIGAKRAMSAFGNSSGSVSQAMAAPLEELDAEEDFLDDETTRIHDYPDADATVVAGAGAVPFVPERRPTPVVPAQARSPLETEVPDLFGPDMAQSFVPSGGLEPAPGEFLDQSLLDPAVPTVPPPAGVPSGPGIPVEAFRLPTEPAPAASFPIDTSRPPARPSKKGSGGSHWVLLLVALLVVAGGGVAGWQLGMVEQLKELAAPYIGDEIEVFDEASPDPQPVAQEPVEEVDPEVAEPEPEVAVEDPPAEPAGAADAGPATLVVRSRPMGAFVSVDGKSKGRTPITLQLEPGTEVSLSARARGYLPRTQQVTVQPGSSTVSLALPTLPYFVEVVSDPAGARAIAVGGGEITTPGEMRFKSMLSTRSIMVSKDGYQTVSRNVTRREFRQESNRMVTSISVELQPEATPAPEVEEPVTEDPEPEEAAPVEAEPAPEPVEAEAEEAPDATETTDADSL